MSVKVIYEFTPNPQSLKFVVDKKICDQNVKINNITEAKYSPLAQKILGFPWAAGVFLGENFITITKHDWVEWDIIADPVCELIKEHLKRGEAVLLAPPDKSSKEEDLVKGKKSSSQKDTPEMQKIKQILEQEIQPAVAMDGGYIDFVSFENGIVYLDLQGACSGCPSSSLTLKQGIESRLKQFVPSVKEVVAV